jgi:hypothetical protein
MMRSVLTSAALRHFDRRCGFLAEVSTRAVSSGGHRGAAASIRGIDARRGVWAFRSGTRSSTLSRLHRQLQKRFRLARDALTERGSACLRTIRQSEFVSKGAFARDLKPALQKRA